MPPSKADIAHVDAVEVATKAFKKLYLAGYKDAQVNETRLRLHHSHGWYSVMKGETPTQFANRVVKSSHDGDYRKPKQKASKAEIAKSLRAAVAASLAAGKPGLTMTARGRSIVGAWVELDGALAGLRLMATEENKSATQAFPSRAARIAGGYSVEFPVGSHLDYVARVLAERAAKAGA